MAKTLKIPINDTRDYISIFNFIFNLTKIEIEILAEFIDLYRELSRASININPFSTDMKKKVANNLGRKDFNTLNNYIKSFQNKKAIKHTNVGYEIHPLLIPMDEDEIRFIIK